MNEFDRQAGRYTGSTSRYRLESPGNSIGDAIAVDANRFLIMSVGWGLAQQRRVVAQQGCQATRGHLGLLAVDS